MIKQLRRTSGLTVDEFLAEYANVDDGNLYELQNGEVVVTPPPGAEHGGLHTFVSGVFWIYDELTDSGIKVFDASAVEFSDNTLRGPDISVYRKSDKLRILKGRAVGTPSLIVEIVSPHKPNMDLIVKRGMYQSEKVPEIWFLDSNKRKALFVFRTRSGYQEQAMSSGIFESKVLNGLRLDVAALLAEDKKRIRKTLEGK